MVRRGRTGIATSLLAVFLLALSSGPVAAHAVFVRSSPPDGAIVGEPPDEISLVFSEAIAPEASTFELVSSDGQAIPLGGVRADPADASHLIVAIPRLEPDVYRLAWVAYSTEDLHATVGSMVFGLDVPVAGGVSANSPAGATVSSASVPEVVTRWLQVVGLALLVGALVLRFAASTSAVRRSPGRSTSPVRDAASVANARLLTVALVATCLALVAGVANLAVQDALAGRLDPEALAALLRETSFGVRWSVGELALAGALVLLAFIRWRARRRRVDPRVAAADVALGVSVAALIAVMLGTWAASGHLPSSPAGPLLGVAIGSLHLAAVGIWIGGLVALALVAVPLAKGTDDERVEGRRLLRAFGTIAATSLVMLGVTGLLAAGQLVATPDAAIRSDYGHALALKIALAGGIALIGFLNAARLHRSVGRVASSVVPSRAGRWLRRRDVASTVRIEAGGAIAVLALAAILASTPPARGPEFEPIPATALHPLISGPADDLFLSVAIRPNRPGRNFVSVGVFDTRRPSPGPVTDVVVVLQRPDGNVLRLPATPIRGSEGQYEVAGEQLDRDGDWHVAVSVTRTGVPTTGLEFDWTVPAATVPTIPQPVILSQSTLADLTTPVAIAAVAVVLLAVALVVLVRMHRRRRVLSRRAGAVPHLGAKSSDPTAPKRMIGTRVRS